MNFNPSAFIDNLSYMGIGMLCIMVVIGVIIVITALLNAIGKMSNKDKDK